MYPLKKQPQKRRPISSRLMMHYLSDTDVLKVAHHDCDLRSLGSLGEEGKVLEEGLG